MESCLITFRSVTPAQRADGLLRRAGFKCSLRRTPRWMEERGCGYSLQISHRDADGCIHLLRENKVPFRKVYLLQENGTAEEILI